MASDPTAEPGREELRSRIAIARSVLSHAPLYRAVTEALAALNGARLAEIAADAGAAHDTPAGSAENLRYWHDGYDAGYAAALERSGERPAQVSGG